MRGRTMTEIKLLYSDNNDNNNNINLDHIQKIRIKNGSLHKLRCETCDFYESDQTRHYGKCKISRQYDGTVEYTIGKWIDTLGCASHSSTQTKAAIKIPAKCPVLAHYPTQFGSFPIPRLYEKLSRTPKKHS
jgi:hypothetical protein